MESRSFTPQGGEAVALPVGRTRGFKPRVRYNLIFGLFLIELFLIWGCKSSSYRIAWIGPGTEQEFAQARSRCALETGGGRHVAAPAELGRIGKGGAGEPDPTLFTEYQARKAPLAVRRYKRLRFFQCMEGKGYRLRPEIVVDQGAGEVEE